MGEVGGLAGVAFAGATHDACWPNDAGKVAREPLAGACGPVKAPGAMFAGACGNGEANPTCHEHLVPNDGVIRSCATGYSRLAIRTLDGGALAYYGDCRFPSCQHPTRVPALAGRMT